MDGKAQLQADPLALISHLLWREGKQFALSQHHVRDSLEAEFAKLAGAFTGELSLSKEFDAQRVRQLFQFELNVPLNVLRSGRFPERSLNVP